MIQMTHQNQWGVGNDIELSDFTGVEAINGWTNAQVKLDSVKVKFYEIE